MADKKPQRFDFDPASDGNEVPTLTSLLYKKNVVKPQGSPGAGRAGQGLAAGRGLEQNQSNIMTLEPTVTIERPMPTPVTEEIIAVAPDSQDFVRSEIGSNQPQPKNVTGAQIGSSDRRVMAASTPFTMPEILRAVPPAKYGTTAIAGAGIQVLAGKTKLEASLIFEEQGDAYVLKTIVGATNDRSTLWTGMELSKTAFSDLLGRLQKFGFAEFSTVGVAGQGNFDRATFRTAFQTKTGEWVSLVRVKSPTGPDAIVALFTMSSIQMHLPAFHSAGMPSAKAA